MTTTTKTKTVLAIAMVAISLLASNVGGRCKLAKVAAKAPTKVVSVKG